MELLPEDLHGWNGDSPIFKELILEVNPSVIIEVGSWKGQSTVNMASYCQKDTKIYCVDTWEGSLEFALNKELYGDTWDATNVYEQFISNITHRGFIDKIMPIRSKSSDAIVPKAQLIYIDADHTYEGVKADLEKYWERLEDGGIMFGDDYFLQVSGGRKDGYECGVGKAVDEFAKKMGLEVETKYNNFWILKK